MMPGPSPELTNFDQLWDYDNPAKTEHQFRQLLPEAAAYLGLQIELLTQIARCQGLQGRFAEAHQTLDQVEARLNEDLKREHIRYLLERGRVYNSAGAPDQARPLFLQAWEEGLVTGEDFHAIDAAHMLGIIEPPAKQLAWNERALDLAEKTPDPRAKKWPGSLHNNIGWTHFDQGRYDQALAAFQQALQWRQIEGDLQKIRIARWCVARVLRTIDRIEEALAIQQALLKELEQAAEQDGYVREELGECLLTLGQQQEARPHFAAAYDLLAQDPWLVKNELARLTRLAQLGKATG
jgi:tetratricopeptide (TPR) repeat protein